MSSRPITQTAVTAAKAALRKAVEAYRAEHEGWGRAGRKGMERWALELLDRLASSDEAAEAFGRLKLKDGRERDFVALCILTAELARTFPKRISSEQEMSARLERHDKAVSDLRKFVNGQMTRFSDFLVPQTDLPPLTDLPPSWGLRRTIDLPEEFGAMMHGLDLIGETIKKRRHIGEAVMAEWRVTRKKRHEDAGNIAAIGHLKEEVCRLTGRPHIPALIELARVIWPELSAESVTYALRARKKARSQTK
jgi:hypothetical protein